jgi:hypothetical protein
MTKINKVSFRKPYIFHCVLPHRIDFIFVAIIIYFLFILFITLCLLFFLFPPPPAEIDGIELGNMEEHRNDEPGAAVHWPPLPRHHEDDGR